MKAGPTKITTTKSQDINTIGKGGAVQCEEVSWLTLSGAVLSYQQITSLLITWGRRQKVPTWYFIQPRKTSMLSSKLLIDFRYHFFLFLTHTIVFLALNSVESNHCLSFGGVKRISKSVLLQRGRLNTFLSSSKSWSRAKQRINPQEILINHSLPSSNSSQPDVRDMESYTPLSENKISLIIIRHKWFRRDRTGLTSCFMPSTLKQSSTTW